MYQRYWTVLCLSALALGAPVFAARVQPTVLGEIIDVRIVNVEAVVTDKSGSRVPRLTVDDFRLLVDGQEVDIEYFSEIFGGDVVAAGESSAPGGLRVGERLGTSYLVFIDEFFTISRDRKRVLEALIDQLNYLGPSDRLAVVAWNGANVEMLSSWSQSERQLAEVLRQAIDRPSQGLQRLSELHNLDHTRSYFDARRGLFYGRFGANRLDVEERAYVDRLTRQLENVVTAAQATLRGFAQPPGRKVMLLLSGGWPDRPAEFATGRSTRFITEFGYEGGLSIYSPLVDTANLLGYSLYPIDVPGLQVSGIADASRSGGRSILARGSGFERQRELRWGLELLAGETGGVALLSGMRNRPLEIVYDDTRSFYWLGFRPARLGDDQRHDIRLELVRPGLKLRTRSGYVDFSPRTEVTMAVESALLFGNPAAARPLDVALGPSRRAGLGKIEVPLTISIPMDDLMLLPNGDGSSGQLELRVAAMDDRGYRADIVVIPIAVERSSESSNEDFVFRTTLRMRRRDHQMVVALYDTQSGEIYSAGATIVR